MIQCTVLITKILMALHENVFNKSRASQAMLAAMVVSDMQGTTDQTRQPIQPERWHFQMAIKGKSYIETIGCVYFGLKIPDLFTKEYSLDTTDYDRVHETGTRGTLTAEEVIAQLHQQELESERETERVSEKPSTIDSEPQPQPYKGPSIVPKSSTQSALSSHSTFTKKRIEDDKRFIKSSKPGVLYECSSYTLIDDATLEQFGFKAEQCERGKAGIEHVLIIKIQNKPDQGLVQKQAIKDNLI